MRRTVSTIERKEKAVKSKFFDFTVFLKLPLQYFECEVLKKFLAFIRSGGIIELVH